MQPGSGSARTRSSRRSARAGWVRSTAPATPGSAGMWRSSCCGPRWRATPSGVKRFEQEARAVASLSHPNILALYDVGSHEGQPYLVTELLEGETLAERIGAGGLTVAKAVELATQIAQGLAAAHERGIVHRDLKPGNVFVTSGRASQDPGLRAGTADPGRRVGRGTGRALRPRPG